MSLKVAISESARKEFLHLMPEIQRRMKKAFDELSEDPYENRSGADIKKLRGGGEIPFYRIRVGDYRIVYAIVENEVRITAIINRKKGYGWLE